ncbi:GNAT family N-acetyltransferase [Streptomyces platensis]|uniref:GNAT family N-acetyltransferase n=1 Tax=Streptomyces platensis TaxID=58346 RepID=UPI0036C23E9B
MDPTKRTSERAPTQPLPPVQVREMTEADIDAVSAVRVHGWQAAYRGLMPQAYLDTMSVAADAEQRRSWFGRRAPEVSDLVAEREGEVVGWVCVGPSRDPDIAPGAGELAAPRPSAGELLALYVTPALIGTGIGRALLSAGTARARAHGFHTLYLWVIQGNTRAQRFYERAGFVPDGAEEASDVGGTEVPELRYRRALAPKPRGADDLAVGDLVTERLVLHRLSVSEAAGLVAGIPEGSASWAPGYPMEEDRSAAKRFLRTCAEPTGARHPGAYEIRRRHDGCAIGGMDFHGPVDEDGSVTVGCGLVPSARGQGYASEALRALLAHAREIGITRVKGDADHDNVASQRVMTVAGMRPVAEDDRVRYYEAVWSDAAAN